jgi:protein ImuB
MRRVLAAVLPDVAIVLARRRAPSSSAPLAVVVDGQSAIVAAVDASARRAGVKIGQGAVAATVRASGLCIVHVTREEILRELELVLEVLAGFGPTVAHRIEQADEAIDPTRYDDTAWVDVTGATALAGGEKALVLEARERIDALGHRARIALASGARLSRALAKWSGEEIVIAKSAPHEQRLVASLPLHALPITPRAYAFFRRVGIATVGDLGALPRGQVSARLDGDAHARAVIDLLDGRDDTPLVPWTPPRVVEEAQAFDEGVSGTEALAFVLRGLTSRLAARLVARGEAAGKMTLTLALDRSIVRLTHGDDAATELTLVVALPVPLADADALFRTWMPVIERAELAAPIVLLRLVLEDVVRARRDQLDLSRGRGLDPDRLRHLATELGAQLGAGRAGFFRVLDAHRPEVRSMVAMDGAAIRTALAREAAENGEAIDDALLPTRLLPSPIAIERFVRGGRVVVEGRAHRVERITPLSRIEGVEWWTAPVTREYVRVLLIAESGERSEALVFHDRVSNESYLHGWME